MRLNQEKSSDKDAIRFGSVEDEYLPGPLKGPEFTICSRATLTSLYQSDWVIPSTSVAWKNLYLTEIFRGMKRKIGTLQISGWDNSPWWFYKMKMLCVQRHYPFGKLRSQALKSFWSNPVMSIPGHSKVISLKKFLCPGNAASCPFLVQIMAWLVSTRDKGNRKEGLGGYPAENLGVRFWNCRKSKFNFGYCLIYLTEEN